MSQPLRIAVLMDPIASIKPAKDTSLAMLLAAQARGAELYYLEQPDLVLEQGRVMAHLSPITVFDDPKHWFELGTARYRPLAEVDAVLMRKDPPFDMEYIYTTYLLEQAEREGVLVVNRPQSLRDANEKMYTAWFPQCVPPTLVARRRDHFRAFLAEHRDIILKPLEGMGGASIFRLREDDPNINVVIETLTQLGQRYAMAQRYIPEIRAGDKRIILIDGEPIPYALARIPAQGETRGNLAAGGTGVGQPLTEHDHWICQQVGPTLREKGLLFVGLDVIGDYLTEINVTSPTGVRELDKAFGLRICDRLIDLIEARVNRDR